MIPGGLTEKRPYEEYPEVSEMNREKYREWQKLNPAQKRLYSFIVQTFGMEELSPVKFKQEYFYVKTFTDADKTMSNLAIGDAVNRGMKLIRKRKHKLGDKKLQREINDIKEILGKARLPVPAKYRQSETKKLEELNKNMKPVFRKKTASKKAKRCKCK
jgi:hypothetical protein